MKSLNEPLFRETFPYFADVAQFPAAMLERHYRMAQVHIKEGKRLAKIIDDCHNLMTAHLAFLESKIMTGETAALVNSATVDKVSVSVTPPPAGSQFSYWLNLSPYGQQLLFLLKQASAGGIYIGGTPSERNGFRKAGGVFRKKPYSN